MLNLYWTPIKKNWMIFGSFLLLIALVVGSFLSAQKQESVIVVQTQLVKRQNLATALKTEGILEADEKQPVYAQAKTLIKDIRKEVGSAVTLGDTLLLLDNREALLRLGQAESNLAALQKDYYESISNKAIWVKKLEEARKELERVLKLYEAGNVSYTLLESRQIAVAEATKEVNAIDLKVFDERVVKQQAVVKAAREKLTTTVVTSPFDGVIMELGVEVGESVKKGGFLLSLAEPETLYISCYIGEKEARDIKINQGVEVSSEGQPDKKLYGRVLAMDPEIAPEIEHTSKEQTARVKVKIGLDNGWMELKAAQSIQVSILIEQKDYVVAVPQNVVQKSDGQAVLYVVKNGEAERRVVKTGLSDGLNLEIIEGLEAGETVIVSPLDTLFDKRKVKVDNTGL